MRCQTKKNTLGNDLTLTQLTKFGLRSVTLTNYNICVNTYVYIRVSDVNLLDSIRSTVAGSVFDAVTQELAVNGVAIRSSPADMKGCGTGVLRCGDCGFTVRNCKQTHTKRTGYQKARDGYHMVTRKDTVFHKGRL